MNASDNEKIVRYAPDGDIDEKGAEKLHEWFLALSPENTGRLILDFRNVNYIGSSGIGILILCYKRMASSGGRVGIENASGKLVDLFKELDLHTILEIGAIR